MVGWHHHLSAHEFEQAPGVGDGQGSLGCCSPWGLKESHTTEGLNKKPEQRVHCGRTDPGETCDSPGEERVYGLGAKCG